MNIKRCFVWICAATGVLAVSQVLAQQSEAQGAGPGRPGIPAIFSDNMVLQRGIPLPVWGWAQPGETVTVSLMKQKKTAVAGSDGKWMVRLDALKTGRPFEMTISGKVPKTFTNLLAGDVWICSGQSNMEQGIGASANAAAEIAAANWPQIRLFMVPKKTASEPRTDVVGEWKVCTSNTIAENGWGGFSAVAYYFGRHLHTELDVPIGLIETCWGGTVAEAWTRAEALSAMEDFAGAVTAFRDLATGDRTRAISYPERVALWWTRNDPGSAKTPGWSDPGLDVSAWQTMSLPGAWEKNGLPDFDGVVWYRREITVPAEWAGKDLALQLGPIDDMDVTWFNGAKVGESDNWTESRTYTVPGSAVKAGPNVLTVRVLDTGGGGGVWGKAEQMSLKPAGDDKAQAVSLAGPWKYTVSVTLGKNGEPYPVRPLQIGDPNQVTVLYNAMIAPLVPYGIKGAIWYQGESNAGRALQYRRLLPTMIGDWRSRFGVGDFPFLVVQLANFEAVQTRPDEGGWAGLREAQLLTAQKTPRVGLAVIIDIGEAHDIHPRNKQDVGKRLALSALSIAYGKTLDYSGPVYRGMKVNGAAIELSFDHVDGGLSVRGEKLMGFAIAGEDGKFQWADAVIQGKTVVVSASAVPKPVAVRYSWASNPIGNLYNKAGLPATPFRTDVEPDAAAKKKAE